MTPCLHNSHPSVHHNSVFFVKLIFFSECFVFLNAYRMRSCIRFFHLDLFLFLLCVSFHFAFIICVRICLQSFSFCWFPFANVGSFFASYLFLFFLFFSLFCSVICVLLCLFFSFSFFRVHVCVSVRYDCFTCFSICCVVCAFCFVSIFLFASFPSFQFAVSVFAAWCLFGPILCVLWSLLLAVFQNCTMSNDHLSFWNALFSLHCLFYFLFVVIVLVAFFIFVRAWCVFVAFLGFLLASSSVFFTWSCTVSLFAVFFLMLISGQCCALFEACCLSPSQTCTMSDRICCILKRMFSFCCVCSISLISSCFFFFPLVLPLFWSVSFFLLDHVPFFFYSVPLDVYFWPMLCALWSLLPVAFSNMYDVRPCLLHTQTHILFACCNSVLLNISTSSCFFAFIHLFLLFWSKAWFFFV